MVYRKFVQSAGSPAFVPQNQQLTADQIQNHDGAYVFGVDNWLRLSRFLTLGSTGNTYYAKAEEITEESAEAVIECIKENGKRVVNLIVTISEAGRAPKNEPAIFALALCMKYGDLETRQAASEAVIHVCRTGTHILHFASYMKLFKKSGRLTRSALSSWYTKQAPKDLAYQVVKYQSRDGWTHKDVLRLAHTKPNATFIPSYETGEDISGSKDRPMVLHWIAKGWDSIGTDPHPTEAGKIIWATEKIKTADKKEAIALIKEYKLPREVVPSEYLTDPAIWQALVPHTGLTALIRNLGNLTKIGYLTPANTNVAQIVNLLTSQEMLRKARIHPIAILAAMMTYKTGKGSKGHGEWIPIARIIDALDKAFYLSFGNVKPSNKRTLLCLDVSPSMASGECAGVAGLSPREVSAAMALVSAATEPDYQIMAFAGTLVPLAISPRQRLDDAIAAVTNQKWSSTDCSLPMRYALENKIPIDTFVIYTDSETNHYTEMHPAAALNKYRATMKIPAKLVVAAMENNQFTVGDPNDAGTMNVVGADLNVPNLISDFSAS